MHAGGVVENHGGHWHEDKDPLEVIYRHAIEDLTNSSCGKQNYLNF